MSAERSRRELELGRYWRVMQEGGVIISGAEYRDELEIMAMYTDWPAMKAAVARNASRFDRPARLKTVVNR